MSRPEIVDDVIAAAAAVPQALDRLSEEARAAWAGQLAADVAAERRAAGITVAPEAALHRALQARTDELERVRAELTAEKAFSALVHRRLVEARAARDTAKAAYDETAAACSELRQSVRYARELAADLDTARAERDAAVRERDEARASITRFAEAAAAHDANADVFVDDEYHISTRALVEEFCLEHGHPLAHEWATAKINASPDGGAPTAPDVALPCAPAAGAVDPLRLSGLAAPRPLATWWPASDTRVTVACDIPPSADSYDTQALLRCSRGE